MYICIKNIYTYKIIICASVCVCVCVYCKFIYLISIAINIEGFVREEYIFWKISI